MAEDLQIAPASEIWIAPGAGPQLGTVLVGLRLADPWEDGDGREIHQVAIGMTIEQARTVIRAIQDEIDSLVPRKGSDPFPVQPLYPAKWR